MDDWQLLQEYAKDGSESAFTAIVNRHLNLVHSVAMRQVNNPQLAEEISQAVFILLARKAAGLRPGAILAGWLFRTTRFVARRTLRTEYRRQRREKEAHEMQMLASPDQAWNRIGPQLDEALENLHRRDRDAVLLRFFENKSHGEVGAAMGLTEEAARKRVNRALDRLRMFFSRRGFTVSAVVLGSALATHAGKAAPAGLVHHVAAAAILGGEAGVANLPAIVKETLSAWRWAKVKLATVTALVGAAGAAVFIGIFASSSNTPVVKNPTSSRPAEAVAQNESADLRGTTNSEIRRAGRSRGNVLRFHVIEQNTGVPVAYARLALSTQTAKRWEQRFDLMTDRSGSCDVPVPLGTGSLEVGLISSGWGARFVTWLPYLGNPLPEDYTLRAERVTNSIGGWLRDEAGNPITDAEIWMRWFRDFVDVPVARSDASGHWACSVIPAQNEGYKLQARHPSFADAQIESSHPDQADEDLKRESFRALWAGTLVTTLNPGLTLTGRVTDQAGQPLGGVKVAHKASVLDQPIDRLESRTDFDGRFVLPKLAVGNYDFTATAEGFAPEYRRIKVQPGMEPVEIRLKTGAVLRLRLVDEQGAGVPGAMVRLQCWGEHGEASATIWQADSGSDGRVEWSSAPNGMLQIGILKEGFALETGILVPADGQEHVFTLQRALTVEGHVVDAETGDPVAAFKVFRGFDREPEAACFGSNGFFRLRFAESIKPGRPWWVHVEAEGYETRDSAPLSPAFEGTLQFALKHSTRSGPIRGWVFLPDGTPAAGAQVALLTLENDAWLGRRRFLLLGSGRLISSTADARGFFEFSPDSQAHSVAAACETGFARQRLGNGSQPVTLRLEPWGRIEGTVAVARRPRPFYSVELTDDAAMHYSGAVRFDPSTFRTKPDSNGRFVFEDVPPGQFSLSLNRGVGLAISDLTEVTVRPGETAVAQIGGSGWTVVGKLTAEAGRVTDWAKQTLYANLNRSNQPFPQPVGLTLDAAGFWRVNFWQSEAGASYLRQFRSIPLVVASDGSFWADGVDSGTYKLEVCVGYTRLETEVQVPEGPVAEGSELDLGTISLPATNHVSSP